MSKNSESMAVRSEDPEPYLCGNEREPHTRLMEYDKSLATVLTWRPVGSVEADNLAWRFITTEGRTVAVRPVQIPSNVRPFCVPERIESALRAASWLIGVTHGRCTVNGEQEEPDYPAIDAAAREKTDHTARNVWYGKRADLQKMAKTVDPSPWKDAFNRKLAEEAARFWPEVFTKADAAKKKELAEKYIASIPPEQYEDRLRIHVRDDLFAQRAKQHAGLLKRVHEETEIENRAAEQARSAARTAYETERERFFREIALYEINAFIGETTGKKPVPVPEPRNSGGYTAQKRAEIVKALTNPKEKGAAILEAIRSFILHELFKDPGAEIMEALNKETTPAEPKTYPPPGGFARAIIRDADLRLLVRFIGEQIGRKDMPLRVLLKHTKAMPHVFKDWKAETAKVRRIKPADAERFLAERVVFIAECGRDGYPVESMTAEPDVMDCEELESFTKAGGKWNRRATPQGALTAEPERTEYTSPFALAVESGGTRFDPKSGEVIVGRKHTQLVGDALKIVSATADWMKEHPGETTIDLGLLVDGLKDKSIIKKKWPNAGHRIDQLFNTDELRESDIFTKLYRGARGKQKSIRGRHTQLYYVLFSVA